MFKEEVIKVFNLGNIKYQTK